LILNEDSKKSINELNNNIWNPSNTKLNNNILKSDLYNKIKNIISNLSINLISRDTTASFVLDEDGYRNNYTNKYRTISHNGKYNTITIPIMAIINDAFKTKKKCIFKYKDDTINMIKSNGFSLIGLDGDISDNFILDFITYQHKNCMLSVSIIGLKSDSKYVIDSDGDVFKSYDGDDTDYQMLNDPYISDIVLTINFNSFFKNTDDIIEMYNNVLFMFSKNILSYYDIISKKEYINLISHTNRGYEIKQTNLNIQHEVFEDLDLHYGNGFEEKYERLIDNISTSSKGLVLFHGVPGSGKSYCIKHMIRRLDNKFIIFIQPSLINNLTDPQFIGFLTELSERNKEYKENILLIVEEAESVIESRDSGNYSSGISNLLNSTDGILNSALKIQMILTFNKELVNIDKAILREGRLLGNFKFGYLSNNSVKGLCNKLNIDYDKVSSNSKLTVSSIYSVSSNKQSISFDSSEENSLEDNKSFIL